MSRTIPLETLQLEDELASIFKDYLPVPAGLLYLITTGIPIIFKSRTYASDLNNLQYRGGSTIKRVLYVALFVTFKSTSNPEVAAVWKMGNLSTFILFLLNASHFNLLSLILDVRLVTNQSKITRFVSFDYLNRNLFWQTLSDLLKEIRFPQQSRSVKSSNDCGFCGMKISIPHKSIDCSHVHCYYCLASNLKSKCPKQGCNKQINQIEPLYLDT